ncbi:MarR family winged helix-turn-helix transcriptional regulator [Ureibacillus aquaedulcis]|uniref:MarR family winged helix-turn-helix transcriptional regulator n=1 Tax=Ureibacillus aquaedulcis TaxID=3058421 RepID=A0ABT8GTK7_9BACL|nr:MarR family winged helix-turn-helix transcriptional regulator [Ureibacillus sp. BA0131]MDN4494739.1 MarR family winged helix-turn-helix transcriptional regulator [Ureibacillus sp. BA0131]
MDNNSLFHNFVVFTTSFHRVTHEFTKDAKADVISQIQYKILEYIAVSQPVTPSDVNDCMNMSMPNTSRELKKLSEKSLIEKIHDKDDRRKQYIRLSKEGQAMMNESFAIIESRFLERIQDFPKEDLDDIEHAIHILQTKLFNE